MKQDLQEVVNSVHRLAATDPTSEGVSNKVQSLYDSISDLKLSEPLDSTIGGSVIEQIDLMRSGIASSINKHQKVMNILDGIRTAAELVQLPQNELMRSRVASVVQKIAGVFAAVDSVADLEGKSLEAIQAAVHKLYGDQSKNGTFYTSRRGKGFSSDSE